LKRLENDLSKLRTGGRFNPEVLESLRVSLKKDSKKTERLGDLAQVLPKGGRMLMILVGEKDVSFCCLLIIGFEKRKGGRSLIETVAFTPGHVCDSRCEGC